MEKGEPLMADPAGGAASQPRPTCADPNSTDCVFLTCFESEFAFLATLLRHAGVRLHLAGTLEQADFLLTVTGATVLLCDTVFLDGTWIGCLEMLAHFHRQVSLLVVAEKVDEAFLAGALDHGVHAIVWKPLGYCELRRFIRAARNTSVNRILSESGAACELA